VDIKALRNLAKARQRAAGKKISRLKSRGVDIAGTGYDPRKDIANINRLNGKQLNAFIERLDTFTSRSTSFVASGNPRDPFTRAQWNRYEKGRKAIRNKGVAEQNKFSNVPLMNQDQTIGQRDSTSATRREGLKTYGDVTTRLYEDMGPLRSTDVMSPAKLNQIIKSQEKRLAAGYAPKKLAEQREQALDMAASFGDDKMMEDIKDLSDDEFNMWFNYTAEASNLKRGYVKNKDMANGKDDPSAMQIAEDSHQDLVESLAWAKNPFGNTGTKAVKTKRSRRR
jgi:hypothetical protein